MSWCIGTQLIINQFDISKIYGQGGRMKDEKDALAMLLFLSLSWLLGQGMGPPGGNPLCFVITITAATTIIHYYHAIAVVIFLTTLSSSSPWAVRNKFIQESVVQGWCCCIAFVDDVSEDWWWKWCGVVKLRAWKLIYFCVPCLKIKTLR